MMASVGKYTLVPSKNDSITVIARRETEVIEAERMLARKTVDLLETRREIVRQGDAAYEKSKKDNREEDISYLRPLMRREKDLWLEIEKQAADLKEKDRHIATIRSLMASWIKVTDLPWEAVFFIFEALDFAHRNRIRR
jgi:hypothetical protein